MLLKQVFVFFHIQYLEFLSLLHVVKPMCRCLQIRNQGEEFCKLILVKLSLMTCKFFSLSSFFHSETRLSFLVYCTKDFIESPFDFVRYIHIRWERIKLLYLVFVGSVASFSHSLQSRSYHSSIGVMAIGHCFFYIRKWSRSKSSRLTSLHTLLHGIIFLSPQVHRQSFLRSHSLSRNGLIDLTQEGLNGMR